MKWFILLIFYFNILSVQGFFYTLLPILVIKYGDQFKAYCPWNYTGVPGFDCITQDGIVGFTIIPDNNLNPSVPKRSVFLNPFLQKGYFKDKCTEFKGKFVHHKPETYTCQNYAFCYNFNDDKCICSCQAGFFGDPYVACYQHCLTDDDCSNPLAFCGNDQTQSQLPRCVCQPGYSGNGVMCYKNTCGNNRFEKCGPDKICVPTGPGENDYNCLCPEGQYLDHKNKCVPIITLTNNTVVTVVGKNIKDGSRIELGDCISFTLNDQTKTIFFHKNSGDSIYVKKLLKNENQFSVFFIVTDEITTYSSLKEGAFGLTKLYSVSNTLNGCKLNGVRIFDPRGHEYSRDEPPEFERTQKHVESQEELENLESEVNKTQEERLKEALEAEKKRKEKEESERPFVELTVRNLTQQELAGGLSQSSKITQNMLKLATSEPKSPTEESGPKAEGSVSQLQKGVSTAPAKEL